MLTGYARVLAASKRLHWNSSIMSGLALSSVVSELNRLAPLYLAESWDNVGLLVEPSQPKVVKKIMVTNDLTELVLEEAVNSSTDFIYSYHPPIFSPLKRLTNASWKDRILVKCLENRIAVYSPHTCLDAIQGGINDWLAKIFESRTLSCTPITVSYSDRPMRNCSHMVEIPVPFNPEGKKLVREVISLVQNIPEARLEEHISTADGYEQMTILCPEESVPAIMHIVKESAFANASRSVRIIKVEKPPIPDTGMGRVVKLTEPLPLNSVVDAVKKYLNLKYVRVAKGNGVASEQIGTVALCAGSGSSILKNVKADLYLTGEMSHHDVLEAVHRGTNVILCEHSNTERGFFQKWTTTLVEAFGNKVQVDLSRSDADPLSVL